MSTSFQSSSTEFNRYLFEYRHDGSEWGIEIVARSPQEAKERIKSIAWARYEGEIHTKIALPSTRLFGRIVSWWLKPK